MIRPILMAGAALPCLSLAIPASAQDAASSTSEIVVTATRSARALTDVPASVSVVTSDQIEGTPARTIDDVLRRIPSVDLPIASTNEQHPTDTIVSMRGLSGVRSLVLLDGVPLNDPFFGYVQWSEVPVETIDRVEVVRGGGAPLWGNYAMGGVINILTRPINKTGLVAEAAGGSRGAHRADGHAAYAGDGFGLGLDAGVNHSDGYIEQVESARGAITVPTGFTARTVALSGNVDLASHLTARARVSYYDNDQTFLTRLNTNDQRTWRYTGTLAWTTNPGGSLELTGFHDDERFVTNNPGTPDGAGPNDAEYVQNSHRTHADDWGASLIWRQTFTGLIRSLSIGGDYHGIQGRDQARIFDEKNTYLRTDIGAGNQRFLGAFAQADARPTERLQLLLNLRYQNFYSFNGVDRTPGGAGSNVPGRQSNDVDPRLSIRYDLSGGFALTRSRLPRFPGAHARQPLPRGVRSRTHPVRQRGIEAGDVGGGRGRVRLRPGSDPLPGNRL